MPDFMIDIETLSTHPSNAVILSVGAVRFELYKEQPMFFDSREWVLDIHEQIADGREISEGTLKFWREQSADARAAWAYASKRVSVGEFRVDFREFLPKVPEDVRIWAHGVCFDIGNLDSLFKGVPPWKYNAVRDCRTIVNACPALRERPDNLNIGPAHTPLADCRNQVWGLWEHWSDVLDMCPINKVFPGAQETGL